MKFIHVLLVLLLTSFSLTTTYLTYLDYAVENLRLSLKVRVSMRVQKDLDAQSDAVRINYFNTQFFSNSGFPDNICTVFNVSPALAVQSISNKFDKIRVTMEKNEGLIKTFTSMAGRWTPLESFESFEGQFVV